MLKLNEIKLKKWCKKNDATYNIFQDKVIITTRCNSQKSENERWMVIPSTNSKYMLLKHQNNCNKLNFHYQWDKKRNRKRRFYDWGFLLKSITTHKQTPRQFDYMFKMKNLIKTYCK